MGNFQNWTNPDKNNQNFLLLLMVHFKSLINSNELRCRLRSTANRTWKSQGITSSENTIVLDRSTATKPETTHPVRHVLLAAVIARKKEMKETKLKNLVKDYSERVRRLGSQATGEKGDFVLISKNIIVNMWVKRMCRVVFVENVTQISNEYVNGLRTILSPFSIVVDRYVLIAMLTTFQKTKSKSGIRHGSGSGRCFGVRVHLAQKD